MKLTGSRIADAATRMGVTIAELEGVLAMGEERDYKPGDHLFYESTPRLWFGVVLEGDVELSHGLNGAFVHLATASEGSLLSESILFDELPHATTAMTRTEAKVWQLSLARIQDLRNGQPELFYRICGNVASQIGRRLRESNRRLALLNANAPRLGGFRREHDLLGERDIPAAAYYGIQTLRAVENCPLSGIKLHHFRHFIVALAYVKKAAALANQELGVLKSERSQAIVAACDEIIDGKLHHQFVVDMFQGGAGTSTNMNANEVIANRALELMGHDRGQYQFCHPNDHVNCSQSTNDVYPTAVKLGIYLTVRDTLSALRDLRTALQDKSVQFGHVLKMGRTENQDAVPMTLGQEFGAYAVMIGDGLRHLDRAASDLLYVNMGATAIGTGINSPPGYSESCTRHLAAVSGLPVQLAENLVEATQDSGEFSMLSGAMKSAAVQLSKICNDLRWLSSGPRSGLYEIRLPAMQPGSSIMPGKVNPVILEAVNQICYQIIGFDMTVSMAAEASELELNMAEPVIAFDVLFGLTLLRNGAIILASRCISGIEANEERCLAYVQNSIGLATALNPVLGYERSVAIAKEALLTGGSVYELVLQKGWLTRVELDELLKPENMTHPRQLPTAPPAAEI
ncbi:MAG: aspartate ammonia-lyase [Verrucomicrobium sp.]